MEITEKIIGRVKLSASEAKVMRVSLNLPAAGKKNSKTRIWVQGLDRVERNRLLRGAKQKIQEVIGQIKGLKGELALFYFCQSKTKGAKLLVFCLTEG